MTLLRLIIVAISLCGGCQQSRQIISHTLDYSTFFGGSNDDRTAGDQTTDSQGNLYVVGNTPSPDFPVTPGAFDTTFNSTGRSSDGFVAKFSPSGQLLWSTYLGGTSRDELYGVKVDAQGFVYVAGAFGPNAPTTVGTVQPNHAGGISSASGGLEWDGYIAKIKPDGSGLVWATYLGTGADDVLRSMDIDANGNVVVATGYTPGYPWPSSWFTNSFQSTPQGGDDTVLIKVSSDGSHVIWATYLGGSGAESRAPGMVLDAGGNVFVLLGTNSTNMPITTGAFDSSYNGGQDAYVAKLTSDGRNLIFATYLGSAGDEGTGGKSPLILDNQGNLVVALWTTASNFPTTPGVAHPNPVEFTSWGATAVVLKLSQAGALLASTYMGHIGSQEAISLDSSGNVYTVGQTSLANKPVTADAFQPYLGGKMDAYIEKLSSDLKEVLYATYLGGSGSDYARMTWGDIANNAVYVFGGTNSANFPLKNAWQSTYAGGDDIFITKFSINKSAVK
jgi:hypothetical protein